MGYYSRYISDWENRLANRDTNRVVRPFEWGLEWLGLPAANGSSGRDLGVFTGEVLQDSSKFFEYSKPSDFRLVQSTLRFTSPVQSPYRENNDVHAEYFPSPRARGRAVVVIPQWNSPDDGHFGLCKLLNQFGLSAIRLSPAYHHRRKPHEIQRADYHMSSNVGRTIHAMRQSAIDTRACVDWLNERGYGRVGIIGTSLGSCIALLATAHDARLKAAVFNHVSLNVAEVVWTGISCRHIRQSFENHVALDDLRRYWSVISPSAYLDKLAAQPVESLLIWARLDTTFLPEFSRAAVAEFRRRNLKHQEICLPCGHYTSGQFPFNVMDGLAITRFLHRML